MDDDTRGLITKLFSRVGMSMEDASPVVLMAGSGDHAALEEAVLVIKQAAEKVAALASAVRAWLGE